MSLIQDFVTYCSCYEIPRNYAIWGGLGLMAASLNRRLYVKQGDIVHHANLYLTFVGEQGDKKSTCNDFARAWFKQVYPNIPVGSSVQSREDIVKFMASAEGMRAFTNAEGVSVEFHPYMLFINELENFLSFNIPGMLSFLTDVYDRPYFDSSTIKRGLEKIPNPCLNIIACVTPQWLIEKLRGSIITGGFCRRMIFIYEIQTKENAITIPRPIITTEARLAEERIIAHLEYTKNICGEFQFTTDGAKYFDDWYINNKKTLPEDPLMRGYKKTKDVQLLKICMCYFASLKGCMDMPKVITPALLEVGLAFLDSIELNMPKLAVAAGRNELVVPQRNIIDFIERKGGVWPEKWIMRDCDKDLAPHELMAVLKHLQQSDQLFPLDFEIEGLKRRCYATRAKMVELKKMSNGS